MNSIALFGQISLAFATLALAIVAWSGARRLTSSIQPALLWTTRLWSVGATLLAFAQVVLSIVLPGGPAETAYGRNAWLAASTSFAFLILTLLDVLLGLRGVSRAARTYDDLTETQRRSDNLMDRLPELVFSLDLTGCVITVNAATFSLLGYTPAEMIGRRFSEFMARDEQEAIEQDWQDFKQRPGTRTDVLPMVLLTRAGERIPMLVSVTVRRDASGQFVGVDGIARDNRAREAYERAMREHAEKLEHLFSLALTMGSSLQLEDQMERLLDIVQSAIGYDTASVFLVEAGDFRAVAQRGYASPELVQEIRLDKVAPAHIEIMRQTRRPIVISDTQCDPDWRCTEASADTRSWMGAPLLARDEIVGVINLDCRRPNRYSDADAKLLGSIAAQTAAAIHNSRLFAQVQEQANHLKQLTDRLLALQAASLILAQASSRQQALKTVRLVVADLITDTYPAAFILTDADQEMAELASLDPEDGASADIWTAAGLVFPARRFPLQVLAGGAWNPYSRQPLVVGRISALLGRMAPAADLDQFQDRYGVRSFIALPMWSRDRLLGYMLLARRQQFGDQDIELLGALAHIVAVTIDNLYLLEDLRRASSELDKVISSSMDAIIVMTQTDVVAVWNPAAERIFGQSAGEMVGRRVDEMAQSNAQSLIRAYGRRVLAGESLNIAEYEYPRRDGRRVWLSGHGAPILDAKGAITGALFIIQDATQERAAKRQMQQTEKLSALGQLAAGVAHELNNPLTSIIGYSQLLYNAATEPRMQADLDRIIRQGKRAARIVQNLLTFVGEHEPRRVATDINDVIRTALEMRQYELSAGNISVNMDLADNVPVTLADYHQLQQVFFNLLLNAEQAMLEANSGGQLTIRSRFLDGKTIHIEVQDDGPGIPPESLSRIFDPFFTTKTVGKGTGLGLSICYGIIEEHQGTIRAESEPGRGANFIVELPVVAVKHKA